MEKDLFSTHLVQQAGQYIQNHYKWEFLDCAAFMVVYKCI